MTDFGQDTITSVAGVSSSGEGGEHFPWLRAIMWWAVAIATGVILGMAVSMVV